MARQTGPLKYSGTLGDIRHFKIKGLKGDFAGLKGGPSGDQVKTGPEFKRTRENMNEFGGCAIAGKSVRIGLSQLMKQMSDSQLTGRLTGIMKKINLEDQSEARGYRAILISTQPQYLKGIGFNKNVNFDSIFFAPFTLAGTAGRDGSTLTVDAFNPLSFVNAPAGATHFRLINAISVVSDFAFNAQSGAYEPIDLELNELSNISYSDYLDLSAPTATPTVVTNALPGTPTLTTDVTVLGSVGIEFYQKVGANYYLFNSGNALKVQDIF
ncbi:MAG: hypothetical protein KKE39_05625 [Bacteroidetes bacterium]|nr:hypothetical protein [Bacteroidota bacterium]MBU1371366.1 hypothetical protein [Bacteroidota bacterium]MBU1485854.1 hypothetical protein [Bacteroidota bacterium]MBU1762148.1 hypothetical protein [Bacteroidota bacterium]MBU2268131.1 hypothetical protein [Bacteroidota bacterium]